MRRFKREEGPTLPTGDSGPPHLPSWNDAPGMTSAVVAPGELARLTPNGIDRLLDRLESEIPVEAPWAEIGPSAGDRALVFGDTHGDVESLRPIVERFVQSEDAVLVGLGDYVDRSPRESPYGSALEALWLLEWKALRPRRVVLIQGNHETVDSIPFAPRTFEPEVRALWGDDPRRAARLAALLRRGPLAAATSSGVYLAHAGFPRGPLPAPWTRAVDPGDLDRLAEIVWADCSASQNRRGAAPPFGEADLARFFRTSGLRVFLRGHDPDITGRPLWNGRCLTLHTTRIYARYGGVLYAEVPLARSVGSVDDIVVTAISGSG